MAQNEDRESADHLKGSVKEAIGKLTGDDRAEAEGRREKRVVKPKPNAKPRAR